MLDSYFRHSSSISQCGNKRFSNILSAGPQCSFGYSRDVIDIHFTDPIIRFEMRLPSPASPKSFIGVNIPEKSTDDETVTGDRLLAENMVAAAGIKTDYIKEVCRHCRKGSDRPRVLKIRFKDKYMAMSDLSNKNGHITHAPSLFAERLNEKGTIARQTVRREYYVRNQNVNLKKYVVRDLLSEIFK
ncbi:unnamed protein product [Dracunculus medinensis]|uniref:Uncharacterized protein n=1 Tax=Dracunculus medinensis TaxID=318479 RepID=A0A0N4UDP5_DRAME|nr:unnamed protein product [Dracunculus medinensis]